VRHNRHWLLQLRRWHSLLHRRELQLWHRRRLLWWRQLLCLLRQHGLRLVLRRRRLLLLCLLHLLRQRQARGSVANAPGRRWLGQRAAALEQRLPRRGQQRVRHIWQHVAPRAALLLHLCVRLPIAARAARYRRRLRQVLNRRSRQCRHPGRRASVKAATAPQDGNFIKQHLLALVTGPPGLMKDAYRLGL
jgi:hypothetical protein